VLSYLIWKPISLSMDEPLFAGDAFRWEGVVWRIDTSEQTGAETYTVHLAPWPNEQAFPPTIKGTSA